MKRKENMPALAYLGLWGINSRKVAMGYFTLSIILTLGAAALAVQIHDFVVMVMALAPVWYWFSIKWADNNNAWSSV